MDPETEHGTPGGLLGDSVTNLLPRGGAVNFEATIVLSTKASTQTTSWNPTSLQEEERAVSGFTHGKYRHWKPRPEPQGGRAEVGFQAGLILDPLP